MRSIDAAPYRGRRVRFSAMLRGQEITGRAGVWLRVDTAEGDSSAFDNMDDRPLRGSTDWTQAANVLDMARREPQLGDGAVGRRVHAHPA
jgi:hypothetical protein